MSKENQRKIYEHLVHFVEEHPNQSWSTLLGFALGYYGHIDLDIILTVQVLQQEGKIK